MLSAPFPQRARAVSSRNALKEGRLEIKKWLPAQWDSNVQKAAPAKRGLVREFSSNALNQLKAVPAPLGEDDLLF
jgi:hypothetical protein